MAYVTVPPFSFPEVPDISNLGGQGSIGLIDATGEKFAMIGRMWNDSHSTKSIRNVGMRFGTVTKAGGSALTVSLQDVDLTTGPPFQPDGTQDQTVAIANADAGFTSNGWYLTGNLSADRSVAFGGLVAIVVEYDGGGRLGADAVNFNGLDNVGASNVDLFSGASLFTGSWAVSNSICQTILKFSDGTYGRLGQSIPAGTTGTTSTAYNSGSAADEIGQKFQVPVACKIDGIWVSLAVASGADFDVVIYDSDGSTALRTVSIDANSLATTSGRYARLSFAEVTLAASTDYRLAIKPTTTNNVTVKGLNYDDAAYRQGTPWGANVCWTSRVDAGSWTDLTTRQLLAGIRISAIDSGSGGGSFARIQLGH